MRNRPPALTATLITLLVLAGAGTGGVLLLALLGYTAPAEPASAPTLRTADTLAAAAQRRTRTPDDPRALALLTRADHAARVLAYEGRLMTRTNALRPITETRVTAIPGLGTVVQGEGGGLVLAGQGRGTSLADATAVLGLLADNFQVVRTSTQDRDIVGRRAAAVDAFREDGSLAARFWIDGATGLLLRRDLLASSGAVFLSTWFAELRLGPATLAHLPPMAADPWSHRLDADAQQRWRDAGCSCEPVLPDGMTLLQARTDDEGLAAGPGRGVVHLLYSDGLTEVSLFDQPGHIGPDAVATLTGNGFSTASYGGVDVYQRMTRPTRSVSPIGTGEWVWQSGASVLTLVGPATPRAAVLDQAEQIVAALRPAADQDRSGSAGLVGAIRHGWHRVVTAVSESWARLT